MSNDYFLYDGAKSIPLSKLPREAWHVLVGEDDSMEDLRKLRKKVPWMFRGVSLRSGAVGSTPFVIWDGENEYDTSDNYQNRLGWLANPQRLLQLTEASLTLTGRAYHIIERNRIRWLDLRYLNPRTVRPKIDKVEGLQGFKRTVGNEVKEFPIEDIVHFWAADEGVEVGPPENSPGQAAFAAAGVLLSVDQFVELFFKRGAIKASILAVPKGTRKADSDELKNWWQRVVRGVKNAFATTVVNADEVKPTPIGEGISELSNVSLTTEKREDIATALGIPQSLLFSNAANFATARQDDVHFLGKTIRDECSFIAGVWNEQVFSRLGLRFEFRFESMEIFQEEEVERSAAYLNLVRGDIPPVAAAQILGFDLPAGMSWEDLEKKIIEWQEKMASFRPANPFASLQQEPTPLRSSQNGSQRSAALEAWERHAVKAVKTGKRIKGIPGGALFDHGGQIDPSMSTAIGAALAKAQSAEDVKRIFDQAQHWQSYP